MKRLLYRRVMIFVDLATTVSSEINQILGVEIGAAYDDANGTFVPI